MDVNTHAQIIEILDSTKDMTIATVRSDGFPQSTVVAFVHDNLRLYFSTALASQKALNLAFCDKVSATITRRARLPLAVVLAEMGEPDEAETVLRALIAEDGNDFEARRLLARTLAEADRLVESVQEVEQLVYLSRRDPEDVYLLATAYLKQERLEAAGCSIPYPQTDVHVHNAA